MLIQQGAQAALVACPRRLPVIAVPKQGKHPDGGSQLAKSRSGPLIFITLTAFKDLEVTKSSGRQSPDLIVQQARTEREKESPSGLSNASSHRKQSRT